MKHVMKVGMGMWMILYGWIAMGQAKIDEKRMEQDIEVAENILSTLMKQQFSKRNFFPMEVEGSYIPGYGVTFRLPQEGSWFMFAGDEPAIMDIKGVPGGSYSYSYSISKDGHEEECENCERDKARTAVRAKTPKRVVKADSLKNSINKIFLDVAKTFLADYGDVINQLKAEERITITNRSDEFHGKYDLGWGGEARRSIISAEAKYDDVTQLKQGKITRDQFLGRLKVVNTETTEELAPDLEVFSSLFGRLYREDLSTTYYTDGNIGYERLKDFGVIYYMKVYSSSEERDNHFFMPTVDLRNLTQAERDNKVKELYPKFEGELKENLVEYGRTLRSLKDDEQITLNVRLTKCAGCGIPSTLELSIKNAALKDYSTGKATREATIAKVSLKKGGVQ